MDDLTRALLHHDFESLPASAWQKSQLAAHVFFHTSGAHQRALLPHHLEALQRWESQEAALLPLFKSCNQAGLQPLMVDGTALSLKGAAPAGARFVKEVQVVLDRSRLETIRTLATDQHWQVLFDDQRDLPLFRSRAALMLLSPDGKCRLQVHPVLLEAPVAHANRTRAISDAIEAQAEVFDWKGVQVRLPCPAHLALVAVVLQRMWYSRRWTLSRRDYLDLDLLREKGLTREMLLEEARALGCLRTTEFFLRRCDPWQTRLRLAVPAKALLTVWKAQMAEERGFSDPQFVLQSSSAKGSPRVWKDVWTGMGWVVRAAQVLQQKKSLQDLCNRVPLREAKGDLAELWRASNGVLRASVLLDRYPRGGSGMCVLRSVSMLWWLRSAGIDAELVSGIRNEGGEIKGHAWIEYQGKVIPLIADDPIAPMLYKINFRSAGSKNSPQNPAATSGQEPTAAG